MYVKQNFKDGDLLNAEKLNHIEDGIAEVEKGLEKDWNQTDSTHPAYIKNKPSIVQSDWNVTSSTNMAYIKNKPSIVQSDWNVTSSSDMAYIKNKPNLKPYVIDSEAYTYGDDALNAILEGRQIYIKVPNAGEGTDYVNFMPVLQYQLPTNNNKYLTLFYLKDGIATNLVTALQGMMQGDMTGMANIYGELTMMLSSSYANCPLEVDPVK